MDWKTFIDTQQNAELAMSTIKTDLAQFESFLRATYLIVTLKNTQFKFKKDLAAFDLANRLVLVEESDVKDSLSSLFSLYAEARLIEKNTKKEGCQDATKGNGNHNRMQILRKSIIDFPLSKVRIVDNFDIQMIFPSINIEAIQAVKKHFLANRAKTCSCRACVRCFLF